MKIKRIAGLAVMFTGILMLAVLMVTRLSLVGSLVHVSLFLIVAGLVLHVWTRKRESRY